MENRNLDIVERGLQEWRDNEGLHPHLRKRAGYLLSNLRAGRASYEDALEQYEAMQARYPGFDGDLVGWLADDFG